MAKVVGDCHRRTAHNCSEIVTVIIAERIRMKARITQRGRIIITAASHSLTGCRAALVFTNR
jgi:hypothetical protein